MGFLETLQKIGFGNRGPYGHMTSGAQNYTNYFRQQEARGAERGVSQAIALAAKNGKLISPQQAAEISSKWNIPLFEVLKRISPVNEKIESTTIKKQLQTMSQIYMAKKRADPTWKPTEKDLFQIASDAGVTDPKVLAIAKDAIVRLMPQTKLFAVSPGAKIAKATTSLGGQTNIENVFENTKQPNKDKTKIRLQKGNRKIEVPNYQVDKYVNSGWKYGWTEKGGDVSPSYGVDIAKALDAMSKGADPKKVYSRLIKHYPKKVKEIKSIILDPVSLPPNVKDEVAQAVTRIQAGEDPNSEYRKLASKYPNYQKTIRGILLTPKTLENIDLSSLFSK